MAVAEKQTATQTPPRNQRQVLLVNGFLAGLYLLGSLWLVFMGLPTLWRILNITGVFNEFLADSLLFLVILPTIFGLFVLGSRLEGTNPVPGLRAAAFYLSFTVIVCGLLITAGVPLVTFIGLALLGISLFLYFQPWMLDWLVSCEADGWFHAVSFKPNQGLRVRRTTVIGVMVLVICGIVTLVNHGTLRTTASVPIVTPFTEVIQPATYPWLVTAPFSDTQLVFMYHITLTIPVLLFVVAAWFAWRLVNWPTFADFLIATEAEMNKVSWTTRKRLYQDTIVVLATVVLMTVFLFVIDIVWIRVLTAPFIGVLKHDPQAAAARNQQGAQW
jgi:preprotein translocase SecE subunit